jgi:CheY-like chemotaxis protein
MRVTSRPGDEDKPTLVRPIRPSASRPRVLVVAAEPVTLRLMRVSLHNAGLEVTIASTAAQALAAVDGQVFDVIICDTQMPEGDGLELYRRLKQAQKATKVPFIVLTGRAPVQEKSRALALSTDDSLAKPVYISDLLARVQALLRRSLRGRLDSPRDTEEERLPPHSHGARTGIAGRLSELGVADLLCAMEVNRRSGIIHLDGRDGRRGAISFREGRPVDAEAGRLRGREALYRLLCWSDGFFEVETRTVREGDAVKLTVADLLAEGMRRLEEWSSLRDALPPLDTVFLVNLRELVNRIGDLPDEVSELVRLFDGRRTMAEVIDDCDLPDLEALGIISRLYNERLFAGAHLGIEPSEDADTQRLGPLQPSALPAPGKSVAADEPASRLPPAPAVTPAAPPVAAAGPDPDLHASPALRAPRRRLALATVGGSAVVAIVATLFITGVANRRPPEQHRPPVSTAPVARPAPVLERSAAPALPVAVPPVAPEAAEAQPAAPAAAPPTVPAAPPTVPAAPPAAPVEAQPAAPAAAPVTVPAAPPAAATRSAAGVDEVKAACLKADDGGRGKYRAVMTACRAAAAAAPDSVDVLLILAAAEANRGNDREALGWAQKAIAIDPTTPDAYFFLGNGQQVAGRRKEARAAYEKYLELAPDGKFAADLRAFLGSL